jgi:hypothetical protein
VKLDDIRALAGGDDAGALQALDRLNPGPAERPQAAALALHLGRPRLAAAWAAGHGDLGDGPLLHAAALLRLGETAATLDVLKSQPDTARVLVLRARALNTLEAAQAARTLARQEGDGPALIAAATLMGELLLAGDARAALRALAEGLKVCEMLMIEADPLLLAVLSVVQARIGGGGGKAMKTAQKALDRSPPRSPARVIALLSLGRVQEAERERDAGELALKIEPFLNFAPE